MNCAANKARKHCAQGHQPCPTPWTCGGYANEAHYSAMQAPVAPREQAPKDEIVFLGAEPIDPRIEAWGRVVFVLVAVVAALVLAPYLWAAFH